MSRTRVTANAALGTPTTGGDTVIPLESALLCRLARGDETAMPRLYDLLAAAVVGLACRITGDRQIAEDVAQEAFLRVWRQAHRYQPERGNPRAWVFRIARNLAIDRIRSEETRRHTAREARQEPRSAPAVPEEEASRAEQAKRLRSALDELPWEQRRMIEIAYFEGLSHSEIAVRESLPLGTVKTRIRDGVLRLRRAAAEGQIHA